MKVVLIVLWCYPFKSLPYFITIIFGLSYTYITAYVPFS